MGITNANGNKTRLNLGLGMGMGINYWEWEEMGKRYSRSSLLHCPFFISVRMIVYIQILSCLVVL